MAVFDIVKYDGGAGVFAWKHPSESLSTGARLIVNEAQEALLYKDGVALDLFPSGRYTLDTENMPLLTGMMKLPFGGKTPFSAEIWFINKAYTLDIKWGTASPIQIQDPKYGVFVPLRSHGVFGVRIAESKKFLVKLVGTMPLFDQARLVQYFRGIYMTKVKDSLSTWLIHHRVSILEINAYLEELSAHMKEKIGDVFDEFGIELLNFYINDISVPEDDPAVWKLKTALAKKAEMDIMGQAARTSCAGCSRSFAVEGAAYCPFCGRPLAGEALTAKAPAGEALAVEAPAGEGP